MKKKITEIRETAKIGLRKWCDALSPEKRVNTVISALVIFAFIALYMAFISFFYTEQRPEIDIEHMRELQLKWSIKEYEQETDSINDFKTYPYDNGTE